jgi:hypothetical protein
MWCPIASRLVSEGTDHCDYSRVTDTLRTRGSKTQKQCCSRGPDSDANAATFQQSIGVILNVQERRRRLYLSSAAVWAIDTCDILLLTPSTL